MQHGHPRPAGNGDERTQPVGWPDLRWTEHCWFEALFLDREEDVDPLDAFAQDVEYGCDGRTLRWLLCHVLVEVAGHVGHLDPLREQLDGARAYY